jgi:cell wall-associated NlpC family hydrolase
VNERTDAGEVVEAQRHRLRLWLIAAFTALAIAVVTLIVIGPTPQGTGRLAPCLMFGPGPVNNGKAVIAAGIRMNIPEKGIIVALATALQESGLRNLANPNVPASMAIPHEGVGHDHLSVGIMQQQPWWGNLRDLMTPAVAAQKFFSALLKVGGWQNMAPTVAAQAVQRSAFPDAYADDVAAATLFYRQHLREVMATSGGSAPPDPSGSPPASDDAAGGGRELCGVVVDPKATTLAPGTPAGTAAAKFAQAQIGLPYIWGGGSLEGPTGGGFDCSGLVRYAIFQASGHRIVLPRRTYEMVHVGQIVPRNTVQPGDLVFLNPDSEGPGHVAMVVNPTTIVEAQTFGVPVKLSPFPNRFVVIKRVL